MKKQAIKITTAAAIAASAFVAVAPTQSEAATSSVDKAITKATNQMAKAYDTYHKAAKNDGELPSTGSIRKQVELAKEYYTAATKEIAKNGGSKAKKATYTKKLNDKKYFLDRAENYLAAVNTNLNPAKKEFTAAVESGKQKTVLAAQTALNKKVAEFEATVAKIYGPDARNLLLAKYATPAIELADTVNVEMTVYEAYKQIENEQLIEKDIEKAGKIIEDVKAEVAKLTEKNTKLAENILKAVVKNNDAYKEAVKPVIESVSAVSAITVEQDSKLEDVKLPAKVTVTLSDKSTKEVDVKWDTTKLDLSKEGTTTLTGAIEGTDKTASVNVVVKVVTPEVTSVNATNDKTVEAKLATAKTGLTAKNFKVLVDGKEVTPSAVKSDAKGEVYTLTVAGLEDKDGKVSVNGKETAFEFATPKVQGASAINATQVEVKFNRAVDPSSLFVNGQDGAFKAGTVTLTSLDGVTAGTLKGKLSADGQTLTITSSKTVEKRYDIVVDNVKTTKDVAIAKYSEMITVNGDTKAPTITGTEKISATKVKVTFSEPLQAYSGTTFKYADGSEVKSITGVIAEGATEVVFTLGKSVDTGKEITATFIGLQDKAGNLLTPNPATVTFSKGNKDGVAPVVSSITQSGAKEFEVKFSEALAENPTVTVDGTSASVKVDSKDATKYIVTTTDVLAGAKTVAVSDITDLSGEKGNDVSKVVTFVKDATAPKVSSSQVVTDASDKKEYLEITFDKDVNLSAPKVDVTGGSYVKDYVTTSIANEDITEQDIDYKSNADKKVVRIDLATLLGTKDVKGASYSLELALTGVASVAGEAPEAFKASFVRGEDGTASTTDLVKIDTIAQDETDNNKVNVTFDKAVDGASAVKTANYKIDGAVVESVTLKPVVDGKQVAVLNLKADSNTFNGVRNYTISDIKAKGSSKVMETVKSTIELKENVAPTVTSAKLTATDKVTLTFSEAVTDSTENDFEVYIGGKAQETAELLNVDVSNATTKIVAIDEVNADQLKKGLSFKALDKLDIKDAAGNTLSVPANITIAN